jgi:MFS family permease
MAWLAESVVLRIGAYRILEWSVMKDTRRLFLTLAVANFFLYFGFNVWQTVFNNFAVDELGVTATQIGFIQSVREIPGLLGFLLGFLVLWLSEMRVLGISVLLLGLGFVIIGGTQGFGILIVGTMVMSIGFHFFYPSNASIVLMGVGKEQAPKVLGLLSSISALAAVVSTIMVAIFVEGVQAGPINIPAWGYRTTFYVVGAVVIVGSVVALRNGRRYGHQLQKRRVVFRRDYWLYYVLTFMMGSRRHIFTTFAIFFLVEGFGIDVRLVALLFLVNSLVNTFSSATFGVLVARFGERRMLTANFIGLVGVFLGYAWAPGLLVLCILFVLDNIFFGFNIAVDSYFQKIARSSEEITSNVSMAQTINHISALVVPILGGILWEQISPSATFLAGVVIALISLVLVQFIPVHPTPLPLVVPIE